MPLNLQPGRQTRSQKTKKHGCQQPASLRDSCFAPGCDFSTSKAAKCHVLKMALSSDKAVETSRSDLKRQWQDRASSSTGDYRKLGLIGLKSRKPKQCAGGEGGWGVRSTVLRGLDDRCTLRGLTLSTTV